MSIVDTLKGMFSKRRSLEDLGMDELLMARAQLEREQDRVLRKIGEIEKQKATLDAQGRAERSVRKQTLLAQQILQVEAQAKHYDRNLAFFSKQLRITDGMIFLKENQRVLSNTPLGDILGRMNMVELQEYVDKATLSGSFQLDKLNQLIGVFEESDELLKGEEEDGRLKSIVAGWQRDQESEAALPDFEKGLLDLEDSEGEL
jgi:hypothetical protein